MARLRRLLLCAVLVVSAAGCPSGGNDRGSPTTAPGSAAASDALPDPPVPEVVVVAEAVVPSVEVFDRPDQPTTNRSVSNPRPSGATAVFIVMQRLNDRLEVLLPVRPNGVAGWVKADQVRLSQHAWRMVIELDAHRLTVFDGKSVVRVETIGVGTAATPTPGGRYYTTELLRPPNPDGPYGTFAYGLSGFTGDQNSPPGANGQMGIHGTNDATTLGRDVTLGCIRLSNEAISALAAQLPIGVPVDVRP
jgi:lipoprotein-anchoring transpeptidase ErfK/SrfK